MEVLANVPISIVPKVNPVGLERLMGKGPTVALFMPSKMPLPKIEVMFGIVKVVAVARSPVSVSTLPPRLLGMLVVAKDRVDWANSAFAVPAARAAANAAIPAR